MAFSNSRSPREYEFATDTFSNSRSPREYEFATDRLAQWKNLPLDWTEQRKVLGFTLAVRMARVLGQIIKVCIHPKSVPVANLAEVVLEWAERHGTDAAILQWEEEDADGKDGDTDG